jgi:hypothetical protein
MCKDDIGAGKRAKKRGVFSPLSRIVNGADRHIPAGMDAGMLLMLLK